MTTETTTETSEDIGTIIELPHPRPGEPNIRIDLAEWAQHEQRLNEQAIVTSAKAPELMGFFNRRILDLERLISTLELAHQKAVREAEKKRAEVLLDKVPGILREKNLATAKNPMGSEDLRNAVLAKDNDYQTALDDADFIKAVKAHMRGKADTFLRAFQAVRTQLGDQKFKLDLPNRSLSGDSGTAESGTTGRKSAGWGTPAHSKQ